MYASLAAAAWLLVIGLYGIVTSRHLVHLCVCLGVVQSSTYVLLTAIGFRRESVAPVFTNMAPTPQVVDPVVQALMLTDVVVEATVLALLLALVIQIKKRGGTEVPDEVDPVKG